MRRVFKNTWFVNVVSSLIASVIFVKIGELIGTPPIVTLIAAAIFGTFLIALFELGLIFMILTQIRGMSIGGTSKDLLAAILEESETKTGRGLLARTSLTGMLALAIIIELYESLFVKDRPLWLFSLFKSLGATESSREDDYYREVDYSVVNRYVEWFLVVMLVGFAVITAALSAAFVNQLVGDPVGGASARNTGSSGAWFSVVVACIVGFVFWGLAGLFGISVVRRILVFYAMREEEGK